MPGDFLTSRGIAATESTATGANLTGQKQRWRAGAGCVMMRKIVTAPLASMSGPERILDGKRCYRTGSHAF
jgi:hypothetical protein